MENHQGFDGDRYDNSLSGYNLHGHLAIPTVFVDYVTDVSSNQYQTILTPQDSSSEGEHPQGRSSTAGDREQLDDLSRRCMEGVEGTAVGHQQGPDNFPSLFGTQFDTSEWDAGQTARYGESVEVREFNWELYSGLGSNHSIHHSERLSESEPSLYSGMRTAEILPYPPLNYHQPRLPTNYRNRPLQSAELLEDTYQLQGHEPYPATYPYDTGLSRGSQPWSTYSIAEKRVVDVPPSNIDLFVVPDADTGRGGASAHSTPQRLSVAPTGLHRGGRRASLSSTSTNSSAETSDDPPPTYPVGPLRKGGRKGPLTDESRENAKRNRSDKSVCWHCARLRIRCVVSNRKGFCKACCAKRLSSPIRTCLMTWIPDLTEVFLPSCLLEQHQHENLRAFCRSKVLQWTNNHMSVQVTCGIGKPITCSVEEIMPNGNSLLTQSQYRKNLETNEYEVVSVASPAIGMRRLQVPEWRGALNEYLDDLLQHGFHAFPELCVQGTDCEVQRDLLRAIHKHFLETRDVLIRLSLKLIVITYIMTHCWTLVEETRDEVYEQLKYYRPPTRFGTHTCPRWLNKQLKFLMSSLHESIMKQVLQKIHHVLRGSTKEPSWATAFSTLMILSMATESIQVAVRCKAEIDSKEGPTSQWTKSPTEFIKDMDVRLAEVVQIFRAKYGKFDPVAQAGHRHVLDSSSQDLGLSINQIVAKHRIFLEGCKLFDGPPVASTQPKNSRLVAGLLLR